MRRLRAQARLKRIRSARARTILVLCLLLGGLASGRAQAQPPAPLKARDTPAAAPTTDPSRLMLRRNILTIRLEKGFFEVTEMMDFENAGDSAIVSTGGAPTLRVALPRSSNVRNPRAQWAGAPVGLDPKLLRAAGDELQTTESIPPGRKVVILRYRLADEFGGIRAEKPILYDTPLLAVLPERGRVQASAYGLAAQPAVTLQEREYECFSGAVPAGAVVRIDMKAPDSAGGLGVFYLAGGIALALGLGLGLRVRRRRNAAFSAQVEREETLRAIALLDDRLAAGDISPEAHARERAQRFGRLRELSG